MKEIFDIDRLDEVVRTLTNNKSRSLLTAFGVFWGIFMLVLLLGSGKGLELLMMSNFGNFTKSCGIIAANATTLPYKGYQDGRSWSLNVEDVERIRNAVPGIKDICQLDTRWGVNATYGKHTYTGCGLKGVVAGYEKIEVPKLKYGRYINEDDVRLRRKVCVIGRRIYSELFPDGGNPCGKYILCDGVYYQIVGVDNWKNDNGMGVSPAYALQIPNSLLREIYNLGIFTDAMTFTTKFGITVDSL